MTPPEVIPPPAIDISVVIITYEKAFELGLMLKALSRQTYDMQGVEVIIIDDGSQDDTESAARSYRSVLNIEYVRMPHIGIRGRLRNEGAARARGRRLIFAIMSDRKKAGCKCSRAPANRRGNASQGWIAGRVPARAAGVRAATRSRRSTQCSSARRGKSVMNTQCARSTRARRNIRRIFAKARGSVSHT